MSILSRLVNVFRGDSVNRELDDEMQSHIDDAIAHGRDPEEARKAFGSILRTRENSRDIKLASRLESLRADAVFGFRQLRKNRVASSAAILSLALAIGACTSAFRLIDAILLRPLAVSDPHNLYVLTVAPADRDATDRDDSFDYPGFRILRAAVSGQADLMAISYPGRNGITYGGDNDMEQVYRQHVSGSTFASLGIKPAAGRLLAVDDDVKAGGNPVAVISYDYWNRRFARDPKAVGRKFRMGNDLFDIVGVLEPGFTGTDAGSMTDLYIPMTMNTQAIAQSNWSWFRIFVRPRHGADGIAALQQKLQATLHGIRMEAVKGWNEGSTAKEREKYVQASLFVEDASAGRSGLQQDYRRSLGILGLVVLLVLLIASANVANLMTAQAAARSREMALRVSIGAGRARLVQMVLVEGALIAVASSLLGAVFAWWSAPFVVSMIDGGQDPIRLVLPADWRVLGFAVALALAVTLAFGLIPALRASSVKPMSALRGGEDPHSRRRLMNALVAAQVAFCFLVHFFCGLFVSTFQHMSSQPVGFTAEHALVVETVAKDGQATAYWDQVREKLKNVHGVEAVALSGWPLMSGNAWTESIFVNGQLQAGADPYFLPVSPGWMDAMKIPFLGGRDFRPEEEQPKTAIVNEAFAKRFFGGQDPTGRWFESIKDKQRIRLQIVGYVGNTRYKDLREAFKPIVFMPFRKSGKEDTVDWATITARTTGDPMIVAAALRRAIPEARSGFRTISIRTQTEIVKQHAIRERLLATLSFFFAIVALILAAVGLYGVLNYSVLQRRREIGIRMALGARAADVARRVTAEVLAMLVLGAFAGLLLGAGSERYLSKLLFQVKPTDLPVLLIPTITIFITALLAALPPVLRAVRIDPASMLRAE